MFPSILDMNKRLLWIAGILLTLSEVSGWARRRRDAATKRSAKTEMMWRSRRSEINLNNKPACTFTILDKCCIQPSFNNCAGTDVIGQSPLEDISSDIAEGDSGTQPSVGDPLFDEAGCRLRSVLHNGRELCIPGNMAYMLTIMDQATISQCYPAFPERCTGELVDQDPYYLHVYMPESKVESAEAMLTREGHLCHAESKESVRCLL